MKTYAIVRPEPRAIQDLGSELEEETSRIIDYGIYSSANLPVLLESFDTEFANKEPKPYEFRAKSTSKKLFVISAGVLMNLLLTIVIFWGINFWKKVK